MEKDKELEIFSTNELISFAEYLLKDYEIIDDGTDDTVFELCGTMQRYNEKEIVERYINYLEVQNIKA